MKKKDYIMVYMSGGRGNQMFQYAFGRYLSLKNNVPLKLDISLLSEQNFRPGFTVRHYELHDFNIQAEIAQTSEIPFLYRRFLSGTIMAVIEALRRKVIPNPGREKHFHFDPKALLLGPGTYLEGYWQSEKYFEAISEVIRKDFTLRTPLPEKSQMLFDEIKTTQSIGLFVRRADFVGNKYHEVVTKDYYDQALLLLKEKHAIEKIFIFSDDLPWCQENLHFDPPHMFVGNEYAGREFVGHLILMSAAKHFIIPNSSYAWWAAWLGSDPQKQVIAPKQWFGDTSINMSDATPAGWIRI